MKIEDLVPMIITGIYLAGILCVVIALIYTITTQKPQKSESQITYFGGGYISIEQAGDVKNNEDLTIDTDMLLHQTVYGTFD
jgi:hypothetical protein